MLHTNEPAGGKTSANCTFLPINSGRQCHYVSLLLVRKWTSGQTEEHSVQNQNILGCRVYQKQKSVIFRLLTFTKH